MKKFINEFKNFAMRGKVVDMAIGVTVGMSFNRIISSFVEDVIMPPIGLLLGGVDFSDLKIPLTSTVSIEYGIFFNKLIDFVILAFCIFILIKVVNRLQKKKERSEMSCPECLMSIPIKASRCGHCSIEIKK